MNSKQLLDTLLRSEDEDQVIRTLDEAGYPLDDDQSWHPLGQNPGNFSSVGNQQDDPAGAFVEKVINSIDAVLTAECYRAGIDPESSNAPTSMPEAVERFLNIRDGRLDNLDTRDQTALANRIQVVATGATDSPCYCIIDEGEGQTPDQFPQTFLSTTQKSPKIKIGFVQGKFNAGGSGTFQFCGNHNIQLIVSRRQPYAVPRDRSAEHWGFTVVRRRRPRTNERSSVFLYLAPGGEVLRFHAEQIMVLPGGDWGKNRPPTAYAEGLEYGTVVKLYNYQWRRGIATLETKRQLERALHTPCLPYRITETRQYRANYFSTTVTDIWSGLGWDDEADQGTVGGPRMEEGFPALVTLNLRTIGELPVRIGVWKASDKKRNTSRRFPTGVVFLVNGQRHGQLGSDFLSRLKLDYIKDHLVVGVDCTRVEPRVFEDLFMTSRDRLRRNEQYTEIRSALQQELTNHQGLRDLNAAWRSKQVNERPDQSSVLTEMMNKLIRDDPGLAHMFGQGDRILNLGSGVTAPYQGRKFPTYFRLRKAPKRKMVRRKCPVNGTVRIEFETDAENQYFDRADSPGEIRVEPGIDLIEASNLWNGKFTVRFRVPWDAEPGDVTRVRFAVSDVERVAAGPFLAEFELVAVPESAPSSGTRERSSETHASNGNPETPAGRLPTPQGVSRSEWGKGSGIEGPFDALRIKQAPDGGYDFFYNEDCQWLVREKADPKNDAGRMTHWFSWGLSLSALGMIRKVEEGQGAGLGDGSDADERRGSLDLVERACDGLAQVIVPMFRCLYDGPPVG